MKNFLKRNFAFFLSLVLIASVFVTPAFAVEEQHDDVSEITVDEFSACLGEVRDNDIVLGGFSGEVDKFFGVGDYKYKEKENNDAIGSANLLYSDYTVSGVISGQYDMDYYKITLSKKSYIQFICSSSYSTVMVGLYSSSGEIIAVAESDYSDGYYMDVLAGNLNAGTYYFLIIGDTSSYTYRDYLFYYMCEPVTSTHTHSYTTKVVKPTCTAQGYTLYTCSCGYSYKGNYTNAKGHSYGSWYTVTAATCYSTGTKRRNCNNCSAYETGTLPTINHTPGSWFIDVHATCTSDGSKHNECTMCGAVIETKTIPAAHSPSEWIVDTVNLTQSKECTVCGMLLEYKAIVKPETPKVKASNTIKGMKVTWNAVDGAMKYDLYKRLGTESTWTYVTTTTGTSYADNNAPSAGSYYVYTVKAYNIIDTPSDYVRANCATVQRVVAPYTKAANALGGINVTWGKVAGANKYVVLRRIGTETTWETLYTTTGTSFLDKNVKPGVYYLYSIRAVNGTGYSEYDINKRITVQRVVAPYTNTVNVVNGVNVTWGKVAGAAKYGIYRRVGGSSVWSLVGTTTGTSFVDRNVNVGKYYIYSIRAINNTGYSAFDTQKTDTIQPITAPTVRVQNQSNGVYVTWNKVAGATKYNVYRRLGGTNTWVYVATTTSTGGVDKGAVKGKSYAYSIRAINGTGYSAYDSSKCAAIKH